MKSLALVLVCLSVIAFAQPSISEEGVWKDFTNWLQRQPPNSKPGDLIRSYRESLLKQGIPDEEAGLWMSVVSNSIFTRRKGVELLWDKVYAGNNPIFIQSPSAVVMGRYRFRSVWRRDSYRSLQCRQGRREDPRSGRQRRRIPVRRGSMGPYRHYLCPRLDQR